MGLTALFTYLKIIWLQYPSMLSLVIDYRKNDNDKNYILCISQISNKRSSGANAKIFIKMEIFFLELHQSNWKNFSERVDLRWTKFLLYILPKRQNNWFFTFIEKFIRYS